MDIFALSKAIRRVKAASLRALFSSARHKKEDQEIIKSLQESEERRIALRVSLDNMSVHVTDGCFFTPAFIENISSTGICLRNLPEHIFWRTEQLVVYSSNNHIIPVLHIIPVWERADIEGKMIGARILNASGSWGIFLSNILEKASD